MKTLRSTLKDFSNLNQFKTRLPKGRFDAASGVREPLLVMVSVSDGLGAICNITKSVEVDLPASSLTTDDELNRLAQLIADAADLEQAQKSASLVLIASELSRLGEQGCYCNNSITDNPNGECSSDDLCSC